MLHVTVTLQNHKEGTKQCTSEPSWWTRAQLLRFFFARFCLADFVFLLEYSLRIQRLSADLYSMVNFRGLPPHYSFCQKIYILYSFLFFWAILKATYLIAEEPSSTELILVLMRSEGADVCYWIEVSSLRCFPHIKVVWKYRPSVAMHAGEILFLLQVY